MRRHSHPGTVLQPACCLKAYCARKPPSTGNVCPVIMAAAGAGREQDRGGYFLWFSEM